MKYKEFVDWCNLRACDGRWSVIQAIRCIETMSMINSMPFWKREKEWRKIRDEIEKKVVAVVEKENKTIVG